jgi:hypothetical protein
VTQARLAAKKLGVGASLRRNVSLTDKSRTEVNWRVQRIWIWNGKDFVDVTRKQREGAPDKSRHVPGSNRLCSKLRSQQP